MAVLFSLSAITAVRWYEWELRPLQKYGLAGTRLRPVRHSQGWESSSDYKRNWKADRYGIWEQLDSQNGFFNCYRSPRPKWANWTRRLHRNVEANHILLAGETSRDNSSYSATIAPLLAAVQPVDSSPQPEAKTPPSSLPKKPVKKQTIFPGASRQRAGIEKAESWDESTWID